jgi:hypothetical protein
MSKLRLTGLFTHPSTLGPPPYNGGGDAECVCGELVFKISLLKKG